MATFGSTSLQPVQADGGKLQRMEKRVQCFDAAPADECQRAIERLVKDAQVRYQRVGNADPVGSRSEVKQGAVDIEEEGPFARRQGRGRKRAGRDSHAMHCEWRRVSIRCMARDRLQ
jgi:hypothetical protein